MKDIKEMLSIIFDIDIKQINLTEVQEKIRTINSKKNVLIVSSCGSGKTEVAYYLSKLWGEKFIYTLPMKTLATSIYDRLNKYEKKYNLNNCDKSGKQWSIQHSSISEDKFLANDLCVTTIDQVLSGYLGIGVQSFIKGKNVINSDIVFDEIQLFEPGKTLKTTIMMLDNLYKQGNRFCIMTATMPKFLIDFLSNRYDMDVIITDKPSIDKRKVHISYVDNFELCNINEYDKKQIVICNTQKEQEELSSLIKDKSRVILLNSKLLNSDRERIEKDVFKYFGKDSNENNKILISTQILEAGMDISAGRLYSSLSPIDSLIQRDGRCCRWGGEGNIIVFNGDYFIYDKEVCNKTRAYIKANNGCEFTWSVQKQWINNILDDFYRRELTPINLKRFKLALKSGSKKELIRDIDSINLIVSNNEDIDVLDFQREYVSTSMSVLKKLSKSNKLYIMNKQQSVKEVLLKDINIGDTCIIQGRDCVYDKVGFRFLEGGTSNTFNYKSDMESLKFELFKYSEEPWISHALSVRHIFKLKMSNERRFKLTASEIERYSLIAGLHDLGKCTSNWQDYIEADDTMLAHNIYKYRNVSLIKSLPHKYISSLLLNSYVDNFESNLLFQHHGRVLPNNEIIDIPKFNCHKKLEYELNRYYGFNKKLNIDCKDRVFKDKDIYTPKDNDWCKFIKIVGILMESDIQAIKEYNKNKTLYLNS